MVKTWRVRLHVGRDDAMALTGGAVDALTDDLAASPVSPEVAAGEGGVIVVQMSVEARTDRDAIGAAERVLRESAQRVWSTLGLPPFTISAVEVSDGTEGTS